jgi:hypothetical protein
VAFNGVPTLCRRSLAPERLAGDIVGFDTLPLLTAAMLRDMFVTDTFCHFAPTK